MRAATPPLATKESATDEAVEEAGVVAVPEVAAEAGEEAVVPIHQRQLMLKGRQSHWHRWRLQEE